MKYLIYIDGKWICTDTMLVTTLHKAYVIIELHDNGTFRVSKNRFAKE